MMGTISASQQALLALAALLAVGSLTAAFARRVNVPDIALFLIAGVIIGPAGLEVIEVPANTTLNQFVLLLGASWLLFDGGAGLRFAVLQKVWVSIVALATVGVLITAFVTAFAAWWLLGLPWLTALLLGTVLAPTDPATLVPIFRHVRIKDRVSQAVISESAFNDATGAILTLTVLGMILDPAATPGALGLLFTFVRDVAIGTAVGAALGYAAAYLISHERRGMLSDFAPAAVLAGVIGAQAVATLLHGSGFMAVFVFGLTFGNRESFGLRLNTRAIYHLEEFTGTCSLIMRLLIFMLLGTQVDFALMSKVWLPASLTVLVFMLVARPLTVLACAAPDRHALWTRHELWFMCWTRETGVIPAALASLLLGQGVPGAQTIAAATFVAILMTILIQAPTTHTVARRLGLLAP